jgi:tRNA(Arg) A34 adenosine deaminase TadA
MCLGAIYWARTSKLYYACSKSDAAAAGFDDDFIYKEIDLPGSERKIAFVQLLQEEAQEIFSEWIKKEDKVNY